MHGSFRSCARAVPATAEQTLASRSGCTSGRTPCSSLSGVEYVVYRQLARAEHATVQVPERPTTSGMSDTGASSLLCQFLSSYLKTPVILQNMRSCLRRKRDFGDIDSVPFRTFAYLRVCTFWYRQQEARTNASSRPRV